MNSSGTKNDLPIIETTRTPAVGPGAAANPSSSGGNLPILNIPIFNIPPWARWLIGAVICAVPLYRSFRKIEDKIEKTAEVAIKAIDKVAEATEKLAGEVADAFPDNEIIQEAASEIKKAMDVIEEAADKAEALIEKVDEIMEEVDSVVDKFA